MNIEAQQRRTIAIRTEIIETESHNAQYGLVRGNLVVKGRVAI
jgi:hypothetical protein